MQNRLTNDLKIISDQALDPVSNVVLCVVDLVFSAYVVLTFNFWLLCLIFSFSSNYALFARFVV